MSLEAKKKLKGLSISKHVLESLPEEYFETVLGDKRGAKRQFRSHRSDVHIREYEDKFTIHVDHVNPLRNPLGHLIKDSPETIASLGASLIIASQRAGRRNQKEAIISDVSKRHSFCNLDPFSFFALFVTLNGVFGFMKELLFG